MKLISIELYLYKPFLHHHTKHFKCDSLSHVTVISGENACGKSSLLRAMSPRPAVSTEFEKGGYKIALYEHNGCYYELSSDFRKQSGAHSFKRDGVELNESGTTEVQNNLVQEHLGYDDIIEKLITGKFKICDLGKPERKNLFMSTYPSSMSFILDKYKAVSSKLRAIGSNIKMLQQRKTSLEQQMISRQILEDYKTEKKDLEKTSAAIDMDLYSINKAISNIQAMINGIDPSISQLTPEYFSSKIANLYKKYIELLKSSTSTETFKDSAIMMERITNQQKVIQDSIKDRENSAKELKKEIDQYQKCLASDIESSIKECENKIKVQDKIITNTPINTNLPALSNYELDKLKANYKQLLEKLEIVQKASKPYLSEYEYQNYSQRYTYLIESKKRADSEYAKLEEVYNNFNRRLSTYLKHTYPKDCILKCDIKETCQRFTDSLREECNKAIDDLNDKHREQVKLEKEIQEKEELLKDKNPIRIVLKELSKFFDSVDWAPYVLDNLSFIESLNKNTSLIYNRLGQLLTNAENEKTVNEAKNTKQLLEAKLLNLKSNNAPVRQLLKDSVVKKEAQLNAYIIELNEAKSELLELDKKKYQLNKYIDITQELDKIEKLYKTWTNVYTTKAEISYFQEFTEQITACKIKINSKIMELESLIQEQNNYIIRLREEILPELTKLQKQQKEYALIEAQLSPTKGISHRYVVRYINAVFSLANMFITRVWSYPMQLDYINEEDETFDYRFRLVINETSSISDINIASAGQKSIINLCVMLAICIFREYGKSYPVILDEVTVNMSLNHQNSLIQFLNELFSQDDLSQIFIVDHCIDVCSSFASIAEMICLSRDFDVGQEWKKIGTIE